MNFIEPKMVKIIYTKPEKILKLKMIRVPLGELEYQFEIGKYPVTFTEYDMFCEGTSIEKPSNEGWGRYRRPVIHVSWYDANDFCEWLSKKSGDNYRLPTQREWEYACRAGTNTKWSFGDDERDLEKYAWYSANSIRQTHIVGQKLANPWGLYDMHGNIWEWCVDDDNIDIEKKITCGASWKSFYFLTSSKHTYPFNAHDYSFDIGFRIVRDLS